MGDEAATSEGAKNSRGAGGSRAAGGAAGAPASDGGDEDAGPNLSETIPKLYSSRIYKDYLKSQARQADVTCARDLSTRPAHATCVRDLST